MKKNVLAFLLCITAHSAYCQQDSLLQKFKFRINHYQALNYGANASTGYNKTDFTANSIRNSSGNGSISANYSAIKSTDKILLTTSASLFVNAYSSSYKSLSNTNYNKVYSVAPSFSLLNKWFTNKKFIELGAAVSSSYSANKGTSTNYPLFAKNNNGFYDLQITTGIGCGRLENITDMQNALWLYNDLKESSLLSRPLSADELNELGQAITLANNTRVLDVRKRTQFILETVDNYLQQKGLISKTDIHYFTHLNDILFFANNSQRLSGTEKFIRLTPGIGGGKQDQTQYDTSVYNNHYTKKSVVLSVGFSKFLPAKLTRQNNYGAFAKLAIMDNNMSLKNYQGGLLVTDIKVKATLKQAGINAFFQHAIYPNTRTIINVIISTEGGYQDFEQETNFYGHINLTGGLNYFVSYRTSLIGTLGAGYTKNEYYNNQSFERIPNDLQLYGSFGVVVSM